MFTLIIPALMAGDEMPLPPLNTPALNQLRRFARFQAHDLTTAWHWTNAAHTPAPWCSRWA